MGTPGEERLQRGYRTLRRVSGGIDAPWTGVMVATADGSGVLVDAGLLSPEWRGWDAAASGHLLTPADVIRRPDGHDVLLPVCPERVVDLLDRRRGRRTPLSAGEGVTVAVSLLRGLCETESGGAAGDKTPAVSGAWWLTESGRPVFATDTADSTARDATVELLSTIAADVPELARRIDDAIITIERGLLPREIDHLEQTLFATTTAEPLGTTVLDPTVFDQAVFDPAVLDPAVFDPAVFDPAVFDQAVFDPTAARSVARGGGETALTARAPRSGWLTSLVRHVDADWADALSRATTGLWRAVRAPRPRAGHRRPSAGGDGGRGDRSRRRADVAVRR